MAHTGHVPDFEPVEVVDLVGGALCFDFTNTASGRLVGPLRERLGRYVDLLTWSRRVGLLDDAQAAELADEAERRPAAAAGVLERARVLRELIYRVFSAVAAHRAPDAADVDALNELIAEAGAHRRLERESDRWTWTWSRGEEPLAWPLWPVVESAAEMLTAGEVERVKECQSDDCTWLFYDASRNRSRRWCDMKDCGNAEKQRRHYRKTRAEPS
jgi:predicted RNA-binding Zn ribbon-like protein